MGNSYHTRMCEFECRLKYAIGRSGCIPWDYPVPLDNPKWQELPTCKSANKTGNNTLAKFDWAMKSADSLDNCKCETNCEEVNFELQVLHKSKA